MSNYITVRVASGRYTVDPVYQWDKNRTLQIYGLSLASVPEIHFKNDSMEKAIVRQASMDSAGVITAEVPNSFFQKYYTIRAYICEYDGEKFKTSYLINIPIIERAKPADYTIEDTDGEIYSFNELSNEVANAVALVEAKAGEIEGRYGELDSKIDKTAEDITTAYRDEIQTAVDTAKTELANETDQKIEDAVKELENRLDEIVEDPTASDIGFTPPAGMTAGDVQTAIVENRSDINALEKSVATMDESVQANAKSIEDLKNQSGSTVSAEGVLVAVPTTGWSSEAPYTLSVPVEGVVQGVDPIFYLVSAGDEATEDELEAVGLITDISTDTDMVTIEVSEIPAIGFTIALYGLANDVEFSPADFAGLAGRVSQNEADIIELASKIETPQTVNAILLDYDNAVQPWSENVKTPTTFTAPSNGVLIVTAGLGGDGALVGSINDIRVMYLRDQGSVLSSANSQHIANVFMRANDVLDITECSDNAWLVAHNTHFVPYQ